MLPVIALVCVNQAVTDHTQADLNPLTVASVGSYFKVRSNSIPSHLHSSKY
jgi:hypothetical protein